VNLTIGSGTVTGDIVAYLSINGNPIPEIVDWNLLLSEGGSSEDLIGGLDYPIGHGGNSSISPANSDAFTATATQLFFNFSYELGGVYGSGVMFSGNGIAGDYGALCLLGSNQNNAGCLGGNGTSPGGEYMIMDWWLGPGEPYAPWDEGQFVPLSGIQVIGNVESPGSPVPEPSSFLLFGSGLLGMAGMIKRKFLA
jgi:hypothetical protein